ncbi:hypothetical protein FKM82_029657 [Ascaphus truei]
MQQSTVKPYDTTGYAPTKQTRGQRITALRSDFINHGYNHRIVDQKIHKATRIPRSDLLEFRQKETSNRVPLVVTYNPHLEALCKIARELQPILQEDTRLQQVFLYYHTENPLISRK